MAGITKTDTVYGSDYAVIFRDNESGYRGVPVSALVEYLNGAVSGADGKSLLNGVIPPTINDGTEGDFWLDTSVYDIYGPKTDGDWGSATSLIGPQGDPGAGVPGGGLANQVLTPGGWVSALAGIDYIDFDTSAGVTPQEGRLSWNATDGTLNLGLKGGLVTLQVGQENVQLVKHADNTGLTEGKVVYVVGSDGANMTVRYAQANTPLTAKTTIGIMTENATADAAATKSSARVPLGNQVFPIAAAIGAQAAMIDRNLDAPIVVNSGEFFHVILKMPLGTATASQVIRGVVGINGYFE